MTAKELARKLGLSEAAVSYALNGKPGVSQKTRSLVKDAAQRYGLSYTPLNYSALCSDRICLIVFRRSDIRYVGNSWDNYFYATLEISITDTAHRYGYRCQRLTVYSADELGTQLSEMSGMGFAGIIILATEMQDTDFMPLSFCPVPVILVDRSVRSSKCSSVCIDNYDSALRMTDYLCKKYRTTPGLIIPDHPIRNFAEREEGYREGLRQNSCSIHAADCIRTTGRISQDMKDDLKRVLERRSFSRCYFAANDHIANAFLEFCREEGIRVPEDVAVAGFDDMPFSEAASITTMHVPIDYIGSQAIGILHLYNTCREQLPCPCTIRAGTTLIERNSA